MEGGELHTLVVVLLARSQEAGYFGKGCLLVENQSSPFLHACCLSLAGNSNCKQGRRLMATTTASLCSFSSGSHFEQIVRSGLNQGVTSDKWPSDYGLAAILNGK